MSDMLKLEHETQTLAEYALTTWKRMIEEGFAPLDSLRLIEKQVLRRRHMHPTGESELALRLVGKWRAMLDTAKARLL